MLIGTHQTYRNDGDAQLLRYAESAVLEFADVTITRTLSFWKNNQAGAAVNSVLRQPPHAFQIRRASHVGHRHIAESFHQPSIRGNFEMRFQFPTAHELRDRSIQEKRIENVDVIHHEKTG